MNNTEFALNTADIKKAIKDGLQGAITVAITAATYLIAHPELLRSSTAITTLVLAALPLVVSLLSRWVAPSAPTPTSASQAPADAQ